MSRLLVGLVLSSAICILNSNAADLNLGGERQASNKNESVVEIVHAKRHLSVPLFDENATYTEARRNLDAEIAIRFRNSSIKYVRRVLADGDSLEASDYKNIMQAFSFWKDEYVKFLSTDESLFQESFIQMLRDLLESLSNTPPRYAIDCFDAYYNYKIAVNGIYELIKASPKGAYLRWSEATMDKISLRSYLELTVGTMFADRRAYFVDTMAMLFRRMLVDDQLGPD